MNHKNSLLYDFKEVYSQIKCSGLVCSCCKNKKLCDTVENVIYSIQNLYKENENEKDNN